MPRKPDPKSKAGFVRSVPASLNAADVVAKAKKEGIKLDAAYVYSVRTAMNRKGKKPSKAVPVTAGAVAKSVGSSRLVGEIERIVEAKVSKMLKERLGALFEHG
jgi:hypothetical protein